MESQPGRVFTETSWFLVQNAGRKTAMAEACAGEAVGKGGAPAGVPTDLPGRAQSSLFEEPAEA